MRQEPGLHAFLLERTIVPAAPIISYNDSRIQIHRDYLLMERLPGAPISDAACDYPRVLRQIGDYLAQAHAQKADVFGHLGKHWPMEP